MTSGALDGRIPAETLAGATAGGAARAAAASGGAAAGDVADAEAAAVFVAAGTTGAGVAARRGTVSVEAATPGGADGERASRVGTAHDGLTCVGVAAGDIGSVGSKPGITAVWLAATGTASSAALNSSAVWNRSAGFFSRHRIAIASSSGDTPGFLTDGSTGVSLMCLMRIAGVDPSLKGT